MRLLLVWPCVHTLRRPNCRLRNLATSVWVVASSSPAVRSLFSLAVVPGNAGPVTVLKGSGNSLSIVDSCCDRRCISVKG